MALNFDEDAAPSVSELVVDARHAVMKDRTMSECWRDLADQHTFFKDIAKEGRTRGETVGAVLAAIQGICQSVELVELSNYEVGGPSLVHTEHSSSSGKGSVGGVCSGTRSDEAQQLVQVARKYLSLYSSSPVLTRAQWADSLRLLFPESPNDVGTSLNGVSPSLCSEGKDADLPTPAASTLGHYLTRLRQTVNFVSQESSVSERDEDDGSFAEEQLKELVQCCIVVGRRIARLTMHPPLDARMVREMVRTLQDFVGSSTLEW